MTFPNSRLAPALIVLMAALIATPAAALPACTAWLVQEDGSYWQQCVNDDGSERCFKATDASGAHKTEIACTRSD